MKHLQHLPLSVAVLALGLAVSLPSAAGAKSEGHGKRGRGHASEARDGHSDKREYSRGEGRHSSGERDYAYREVGRGRADRRGSGDRRVEWRDSGSRGTGSRDEVRYRDPRADDRADARWRDSGRRGDAPTYRPSYRSETRYRGDYPTYSNHRSRYYYTGSFHRPRFVHRSGFSIGFVIGAVPSYGYGYFDPYCDMGFGDLDLYYDHCHEYGHPGAILVVDIHSGAPIASCAYGDGYWMVDDCY
jgi:hypothetical protein